MKKIISFMTIGIVTFALASFKQKGSISKQHESLTFKKLSDTIQTDNNPSDTIIINDLARQKEDPPVKDRTRW